MKLLPCNLFDFTCDICLRLVKDRIRQTKCVAYANWLVDINGILDLLLKERAHVALVVLEEGVRVLEIIRVAVAVMIQLI